MFRVFEGRTADEVWQEIAAAFRNGDGIKTQSSRAGATKEMLHAAISVADPRQRWVFSRQPAINPAYAIAELVWIITGRNDSAFLNYFNRELPKYAGQGTTYHGAYGRRLRFHFGIDQLERAYHALKGKPFSRQVVLQIWDSRIDLPGPAGQESAPDVPCNLLSMLKVRDGKLEWTQIIRSSDVHLGLPYDFVQFTALQEIIAGWLGVGLGSYNQISDSLHVYTDCVDHIWSSGPTEAFANTDSLTLPKEKSDEAFSILERHVEMVINPNIPVKQILSITRQSLLPEPFRNILCVLCAEGARRRRSELVDEIMSKCTNAAYKQLYGAWCMRFCRLERELKDISGGPDSDS